MKLVNHMESIQWNWKLYRGCCSGSMLASWESIQWNWKRTTPWGARSRAQPWRIHSMELKGKVVLQPSQKLRSVCRIHSMELKARNENSRAPTPPLCRIHSMELKVWWSFQTPGYSIRESIQWNWKTSSSATILRWYQYRIHSMELKDAISLMGKTLFE